MGPRIDAMTARLLRQSNRIGVDFLLTDLDTAHTFLDIADVTEAVRTHSHNHERARGIYLTVQRLLPRVVPEAEEQMRLDEKLSQLKKRLEDAGYSCES